MESLIKKALTSAIIKLRRQVPRTKKVMKNISVIDVRPLEIRKFMMENNIPERAVFDMGDNGYDGGDGFYLSWDVDVKISEEDALKFKRKRFDTIAFKEVHAILTSRGFIRRGYNSGLLKEFDDTTVYDMYVNGEFERLVKYYSLPFHKP